MEADRLIVSLFDYTGIWSQPYRDAGYEVLQVDIQHGMDIFTTPKPESAHGVILQPPCTDFALSGARWFAEKDQDGRTEASIKLAKAGLDWVVSLNPVWWVLENPISRIHKLIPELGKPVYKFHPYHFGEPISKMTWLWGNFNTDLKQNVVEPEGMRKNQPPAWYSKVGGKSQATKNYRSRTSPAFAKAFFDANP